MLAALESGRVDEAIECRPERAFYLTLFDHVSRAAGVRSWGRHGPRYELRGRDVERVGHFDDADLLPPRAMQLFEKSLVVQRALDRPGAVEETDVERYVAIVAAARRIVETRYPGARFELLQWSENEEPLARQTWAGLEAAGIRGPRYAQICGGAAERPERCVLSAYDQHPNARGHELLAHWVMQLLGEPGSAQGVAARSGAR